MQLTVETGGRPRVWTVSGLVHAIADALQVRFASVAVRGEISGFTRAASGHAYFTLKDDRGAATLRCAMFRRAYAAATQGGFVPRDGQLVEAVGQVAVYEARGELQLVVERLQPAGDGAWYEQFLRLKARLEADGLFDPARKRALPAYPQRVAVVTSVAAAALQDVLKVLARRAPHVEVCVAPCMVQGAEAPPQIVAALNQVQALHHSGVHIDAVILCRGGGSMEDLWAFNDERVVRAVAACTLPVVCGVGHETDVTLSDFAADLRAPTPSVAAELVCRDAAESSSALDGLAWQLQIRSRRLLDSHAQRLDRAASRLTRPGALLARDRTRLASLEAALRSHWPARQAHAHATLAQWQHRLSVAVPARCRHDDARLRGLEAALNALSPQRVLDRGYAWLSTPSGHVIASVSDVQPGEAVQARLADGVLQLNVESGKPV
ncbi:exodeoxyribonuclease VII large subunit [Aquabacterium sp. A3]|uniref:exodeoxyribonuclease VII large subunit n=1 Tax=Aquabacterium sp. A3 TaxID=3132829 RepID=UPI00311A5844